ncbi:hypothetical protein LCGC14_2719870, partial [marine sediment metagenome]
KALADKLYDQLEGVESHSVTNQAARTMCALSNGIVNIIRFESNEGRFVTPPGVEEPATKAILIGKQGS